MSNVEVSGNVPTIPCIQEQVLSTSTAVAITWACVLSGYREFGKYTLALFGNHFPGCKQTEHPYSPLNKFGKGHKIVNSFKSSPIAVYESLLTVQNCLIANNAPHSVISAPGYKGVKSSGSESGSEDEGD